MQIKKHGLSIGMQRIDEDFFLYLEAIGKLSHEDYEKISPLIDSALEGIKDQEIKVFIDASELEGWEIRAAWDDFKLCLKHNSEFGKIAIYGSNDWQEKLVKIGSWFIHGEIKYFDDINDAYIWLKENN